VLDPEDIRHEIKTVERSWFGITTEQKTGKWWRAVPLSWMSQTVLGAAGIGLPVVVDAGSMKKQNAGLKHLYLRLHSQRYSSETDRITQNDRETKF